MIAALFWFCLFNLVYVHVGYPALLALLARCRRRPRYLDTHRPDLTLIIAAYNEESVIAEKLKNSLELNYPANRLQIIVAADGSDDLTPEIVKKFASQGVELSFSRERRGKSAAINRAVQQARGEILVFSDANNSYAPDTLLELVAPFADPKTGGVAGAKTIAAGDGRLGDSEGFYWKYESFIKRQETRLGCCIGAAGEVLATRRHLYEPMPDQIICDDFYTAMRLVRRGYNMKYAPQARSTERVSPSAADEADRRSRIVAGRYQSIAMAHKFLSPRRPVVAWQTLSHKFLRPLVPFFLIGAFVAAVAAVIWPASGGAFGPLKLAAPYNWLALVGQCCFYGLAALGKYAPKGGILGKLAYLPRYLISSNLVALQGLHRFLTDRQTQLWKKAQRGKYHAPPPNCQRGTTVNQRISHLNAGHPLVSTLLAAGCGVACGLLALKVGAPLKFLVLALGLGAALTTILKVEWGLLVLVFITYTNLSDIAIKMHGAPSVAKFFIPLLCIAAIVHRLVNRQPITGWQQAGLLLLAYGMVCFTSLLYAADIGRTQQALVVFAKNSMIVLAVTILLQRGALLRQVVWALLATGLLMGNIGVYQYLTGTFDNTYWGMAQTEIQHIVGELDANRLSGPIADANFFAQLLLPLVALALDRFLREEKLHWRLLALWAGSVSFLAMIFTFSRGAFIALIAMTGLYFVRRPPRPHFLVLALVLTLPLLSLVPAEYIERIATIKQALPLIGDGVSDGAMQGRLGEMLAAGQLFLDHPLLGVGLDNSPLYYQKYTQMLGVSSHLADRSAHSLYIEIAAETGLLGLLAFGAVIFFTFRGLLRSEKALRAAGETQTANLLEAFTIALFGFLVAATFLHDAFPRFLWLLLAIGLAAPTIAANELASRTSADTQKSKNI